MLIEFIGGQMDGETLHISRGTGSNTIKVNHGVSSTEPFDETRVKTAIYRRKPDTNKFYFEKIEEV